MPKQTRYDLEFMAELLGRFSSDGLVSAVAEGMADPFWNERAQQRIATMLFALPHMAATFVRDEYSRKAFVPPTDGRHPGPVESILTQRGFVTV